MTQHKYDPWTEEELPKKERKAYTRTRFDLKSVITKPQPKLRKERKLANRDAVRNK